MVLEKELQDIYFPLIIRLDAVNNFSISINKKTFKDDNWENWSIIIKRDDLQCNIGMDGKYKFRLDLLKGTLRFSNFLIDNQEDLINISCEWIENKKIVTNEEWIEEWGDFYEKLLLLQPDLGLVDTNIRHGGITIIKMSYQSRYCQIYFIDNEEPKWEFSWDNHTMFELVLNDNNLLVNFLNHWLVLYTLPSKLQQVFPSLILGKMSFFWEQGEQEKALKVKSWNMQEKFYDRLHNNEHFPQFLPILRILRLKKYDEILYAGKQYHSATLILSPIPDIYSEGTKRLFFSSHRDREREFNLELYDSWENWLNKEKALAIFDTLEYNDEIAFFVEELISAYIKS